jgi:hypothetical protein
MDSERRHSIRTQLNQILYISIEPNNGAIVMDLSEDGLSFQAAAPVHHRGQLHFCFSSPIKGRFKVCGELEWTDETQKRGGLRFIQLTKDVKQHVHELLARSERPAEPQLVSAKTTNNAWESATFPRQDEPAPSQFCDVQPRCGKGCADAASC